MKNPFEAIDARLTNIETLLLDIKHKPQDLPETDSNQWFDINELRSYLPDKPAKTTVYDWVHKGTIPVHKGGKKLRFLKSEIDLWLKSGKQKTVSEIGKEADEFISKNKRR